MSEMFKELKAMSRDDLISKHDQQASNALPSLNHYLNEIARRDAEEATNKIVSLTKWIAIMTLVMMAATIINVILFALK